MKAISTIIWHLIIMLLGINCSFSQQIKIPSESNQSRSINTPIEAKKKAIEYLGFDKMEGFSVDSSYDTAYLVIKNDDNTPFLYKEINNREIWKVTYKGIRLKYGNRLQETNKIIRTFDVYIDPINGCLLKIESIYDGKDKNFAPAPTIERAEKQLSELKNKYLGFAIPDSHYVSFYDAINNIGPLNSKEIVGLLIRIQTRYEGEPGVVWSITYRGTDPYAPLSPNTIMEPIELYNYVTFIYDAKSGQVLRRTKSPTIQINSEE